MRNKAKLILALTLSAYCLVTEGLNQKEKGLEPMAAKYESFENGVPDTWVLQGKGRFSINPWHYKLGKKSLQWDFKPRDAIKVNNSIGDSKARGGCNNYCFASFGIWIYCKKAMPGKSLRFEFRVGEKSKSYFDFPLNFVGWQAAFPRYNSSNIFNRPVPANVDNILIKAPDTKGTVLIDCVVYNGLLYGSANCCARKTPWQPPKLDEKKYPVPAAVGPKALKRILLDFFELS